MQRLPIPKSDLTYSRLVYGAWRLADDTNRTTEHVRAKIDAALNEGITTFDHADIYGNYECERLFGQVLATDPGLRNQIELVSKCDIALMSDKYPDRRVNHYDTSAEHIRTSVDRSLQMLKTDHLDTLLIHRPDPLMNAAETGAALDDLVRAGKVRSVGVSNFRPDDWRLLQKHMQHPLVINQIEISVLHTEALTNGDLSALQLDDMAIMAWSPLAGGRLFRDEAAAQRVRPLLQAIADEQNSRLDCVAFAWLLAHPANILPVVGTNNLDRIRGIGQAMDITIDRQTWFEIYVAALGHGVP
ncbi:aldo/keto reductase [Reinekea blandensis]|uniref:Aryl-alcohol dehydrogenase n=1 Tax=Reinekea blandensis MED297 TaxID=314283 RepID=A4BAG6_9GAMM|nr:aldo/keto reductase [Reinekea blandensis]EAR10922.1 aryl-alcohol dehydrogenase [Reinekea sp. MED297] [Reinekea blandensis MED297]